MGVTHVTRYIVTAHANDWRLHNWGGGGGSCVSRNASGRTKEYQELLDPTFYLDMASGIVLGLIAGVVQCAADVGEEMVQEERARSN